MLPDAITLSLGYIVTIGVAITAIIVVGYSLAVVSAIAVIVMESRSPMRSLAWLTVVVLLPVIGLVLYLFFGRSMRNHRMISRRRRRRLLAEEGSRGMSDAVPETFSSEARSLVEMTRRLAESPLSLGNTVEVLAEGELKFRRLEADLRNAGQYILLQYYIFDDDTLGGRIAEILMDRARAGVKVRVIYDHLACLSVANSFYDRMKEAGVEVYPFFKLTFPHFASRANWRNHRKLCVIDGQTGYIGGMNIADRYIDGGQRFDYWRDVHLRIKGPAVARLHYSFAVDWNFMGMPLVTETVPRQQGLDPGNPESVGIQIVTSGPTDQWCNIALMLQKSISEARERVYIQTPYFLPSEALVSSLRMAALSNVDVRVMIPEQSDSRLLTFASRSYIQECLKAGVKIYFYTKGMLHSKVLIVDDDISSVGSANFDFRSFELNFEANAIMYSRSMNRRLRRLFMRDADDCVRIHFPSWRRRPMTDKVAEQIVRLLSPLL